MVRNKATMILLGAAIALVVVILSIFIYWSTAWKGKIMPGVRVEWIDVGGLTSKEAAQKVLNVQQDFLYAPIVITAEGKRIDSNRGELGFSMEAEKAVREAYKAGRSGSARERLVQVWEACRKKVSIPCREMTIDTKKAELSLASFTDGLSKPQDARLVIDDQDQITVVPGKNGIMLDLDASLEELKLFREPFAREVELQFREEPPQVSTADIEAMNVNGLISSFTTKFDAGNHNRSYNIGLAAGAFNNTLLSPGEEFSFNNRVGPRTAQNGYREAMVIEADAFVPGLGGGVCQVSSTLYNAVLLAGLEIVERSNHTLAINYLPLGRDATVAYGSQDLKFRNNLKSYVYIKTSVSSGALTIKIFGNKQQQKSVQLETVIDSVISPRVTTKKDANLLQGKTVVEKAGASGYRVSAHRIINGSKQLLSRDYYRPIERVIRLGVKEPTPAPDDQQEKQTEEKDSGKTDGDAAPETQGDG